MRVSTLPDKAALHCVALIEGDKQMRDPLALVLTSSGGMDVHSYCSIDDYLLKGLDNKVQLLVCAEAAYKADHPELARPIFCYTTARNTCPNSAATIRLDCDKLPAFAEQVKQAYYQLFTCGSAKPSH